MALRSVPDHPKFAELKKCLGVGKGAALGYLEATWHFCGRFTPQGNIGKYSDHSIESWVEWDGEPGQLIWALCESGWVDMDSQFRLVVHDWHDHADKATKQTLRRSNLEFVKPSLIKVASCAPTLKKTDELREHEAQVGINTSQLSALPGAGAGPCTGAGAGAVPGPAQLSISDSEEDWDEGPDIGEIARVVADELIPVHPTLGSRPLAILAVERCLASATDPEAQSRALVRSHAAFRERWAAERIRNPKSYIPPLHRWFSDGDYLHPPKLAIMSKPEVDYPKWTGLRDAEPKASHD